MMRLENIPLYDVQGPMDMAISPSFYVIGLICIVTVFLVIVAWKRLATGNSVKPGMNDKKRLYQSLLNIDLDDPKKAAYDISTIGYELVKHEHALAMEYSALYDMLEAYKYASNVAPLSLEVKKAYEEFCRRVYEKIS